MKGVLKHCNAVTCILQVTFDGGVLRQLVVRNHGELTLQTTVDNHHVMVHAGEQKSRGL